MHYTMKNKVLWSSASTLFVDPSKVPNNQIPSYSLRVLPEGILHLLHGMLYGKQLLPKAFRCSSVKLLSKAPRFLQVTPHTPRNYWINNRNLYPLRVHLVGHNILCTFGTHIVSDRDDVANFASKHRKKFWCTLWPVCTYSTTWRSLWSEDFDDGDDHLNLDARIARSSGSAQ